MASFSPPSPFRACPRVGLALAGALLVGLVPALPARAAPAQSELPTTVSALAWMAGTWTGAVDGLEMEESWLPPKGGSLLGLHREVRAGAMVLFEFLRISETADGIVYYGSPRGRAPTPFALVESGERRAVFANPAHDYPQRISYWLDSAGALHARVEGAGGADPEEWTWRPAPPPAP